MREQTEVFRISIDSKNKSSKAKKLEKTLQNFGFNTNIHISNVYTITYDFSIDKIKKIAESLYNPVVENIRINSAKIEKFDYALELGFLPGVTDNVSNTTTEIINDLFKINIGRNNVFSSQVLFIESSSMKIEDLKKVAEQLINILIERYHIKTYEEYIKNNGMDKIVPRVELKDEAQVSEIDLNVLDPELVDIGKKGILDLKTKKRRGPLALDLDYMKTIQDYFKKEKRNPTDIEIESLAQTWSEHCKHTIFAGEIDDIKEGIYKKYIKGATKKIRLELGKKDFCLSVFSDNSGAIIYDDEYLITDKAETHNSPSALDPYGGAITGIVGVNRDTIGFGMGAMPIANKYGYCVGKPEDTKVIFRGKNKKNPALTPKRILEGVVHGVNNGGNCSGIPTPTGLVYFDDCYKGKPLIFVGTIGLMKRKLLNGKLSYEKCAKANDNIVVVGGRVGKDGIHGATFSSEAMDEGSPATAVQIGDPITQKKLSDAIIKEAKDRLLYNSITDNGAGGISCSVAEMAKECGGFIVNLEKVLLKYPGLSPWETWISESQERMTLSVPDDKLDEFVKLMESRGVETTVIGKFNDSTKAIVRFSGKEIMNIEMEFLHEGNPKKVLKTQKFNYEENEPEIVVKNQEELLIKILGAHNNCSFEFISKQYDHEVMHNSVIKPLQGKGRVNAPASVIKPLFTSNKGVVLSQALYPKLSKISCYDMAACSIDTAIRNSVAAGGNINHLALMDNFCWCSSNDEKRLYQLKETAKGCYDFATKFLTPFISGKDSMFNDFKGFDENDNPVKISVLPTLLISSISIIEDVKDTKTMDLKIPGDLIYMIGITKDECGGSEFYHAYNKIGFKSPKVDAKNSRKLYERIYKIKNLISAIASINLGGFLITLAKMSIAGRLGVKIDISKIKTDENLLVEKIFYSETQSRFIITIDPKNKQEFEENMKDFDIFEIGLVNENDQFIINNKDEKIIFTNVKKLEEVYKKRFKDF
jgi:phosphoribosylformylglycinamidine synthase subunit PurSL